MRKSVLALATAFVFLALVVPAQACLNDGDTIRQERQFKAIYPDQPAPTYQAAPESPRVLAYGGSGLGIVLLAAASYVGLARRRS